MNVTILARNHVARRYSGLDPNSYKRAPVNGLLRAARSHLSRFGLTVLKRFLADPTETSKAPGSRLLNARAPLISSS